MNFTITTIRNGSSLLLDRTTPSEYLFHKITGPVVSVISNGIPAFQDQAQTSFTWTNDTIFVTAVENNFPQLVINHTVQPYNEVKEVYLNGFRCANLATNTTFIKVNCQNVIMGSYQLAVFQLSYGVFAYNESVSVEGTFSTITPNLINQYGGTNLTIVGTNLPRNLSESQSTGMEITVGNILCDIQEVSPSGIICQLLDPPKFGD